MSSVHMDTYMYISVRSVKYIFKYKSQNEYNEYIFLKSQNDVIKITRASNIRLLCVEKRAWNFNEKVEKLVFQFCHI